MKDVPFSDSICAPSKIIHNKELDYRLKLLANRLARSCNQCYLCDFELGPKYLKLVFNICADSVCSTCIHFYIDSQKDVIIEHCLGLVTNETIKLIEKNINDPKKYI